MVIIAYLEHLTVKHQTTSGISVLEKKSHQEKPCKKEKKTNKLASWMLLRGSPHKRENHKQPKILTFVNNKSTTPPKNMQKQPNIQITKQYPK